MPERTSDKYTAAEAQAILGLNDHHMEMHIGKLVPKNEGLMFDADVIHELKRFQGELLAQHFESQSSQTEPELVIQSRDQELLSWDRYFANMIRVARKQRGIFSTFSTDIMINANQGHWTAILHRMIVLTWIEHPNTFYRHTGFLGEVNKPVFKAFLASDPIPNHGMYDLRGVDFDYGLHGIDLTYKVYLENTIMVKYFPLIHLHPVPQEISRWIASHLSLAWEQAKDHVFDKNEKSESEILELFRTMKDPHAVVKEN